MGGGGGLGYLELGPGTPPWVRGSIYKKKILQDPGLNPHTTAIRKEVFTPPHPKAVLGYRGGGGQNGKILLPAAGHLEERLTVSQSVP